VRGSSRTPHLTVVVEGDLGHALKRGFIFPSPVTENMGVVARYGCGSYIEDAQVTPSAC